MNWVQKWFQIEKKTTKNLIDLDLIDQYIGHTPNKKIKCKPISHQITTTTKPNRSEEKENNEWKKKQQQRASENRKQTNEQMELSTNYN